jgi:hypothetical protein
MRMVGALLGAGALGSLVAWFTFAASTPALPTGPLAGLTEYGRTVWNLEALLRDRFGNRNVWLDYGTTQRSPENFTTHPVRGRAKHSHNRASDRSTSPECCTCSNSCEHMSGVIDGRGVPEVPRDANDVEPAKHKVRTVGVPEVMA